MSYTVLARKYRPQKFSDVIGQEHVTKTLKNAIEQERIAHGYIFSGHRGIGKTTVARILAMALNCRSTNETTGKPLWTHSYDVAYEDWAFDPSQEIGPVATPIVAQMDELFAVDAEPRRKTLTTAARHVPRETAKTCKYA